MKTVFSAVVLAAGGSGRMGFPKMGLRFDENYSFVENICEKFSSFGCDNIILVVSKEGEGFLKEKKFSLAKNTQIIVNPHPEYGRFYSLKTGLKHCADSDSVFFTNVDNPFVDVDTLKCLAEQNSELEFVCPVFKGKGGHPVLLSQYVVGEIINESNNNFILNEYLQKFVKNAVEVSDEKVLSNINTLDDYKSYFMPF